MAHTATQYAAEIARCRELYGKKLTDYGAAWLDWWLDWAGTAFLDGYLEVAADTGLVPDEPDHTRILLDAFLLEKAVYELGYEMNNRPAWVGIPLAGITQVLDRDER